MNPLWLVAPFAALAMGAVVTIRLRTIIEELRGTVGLLDDYRIALRPVLEGIRDEALNTRNGLLELRDRKRDHAQPRPR